MENATKALLIAAGIMVAVMILSLILMVYNQISSYYSNQHELAMVDQITEFNKIYENYHRDNIRGTELISLMNRIIDYNERFANESGNGYKRIEVTITLGGNDILQQFMYEDKQNNKNGTIILSSEINNTSGGGTSREKDKQLIAITDTETELMSGATNGLGINLTASDLQKLSSNISNIFLEENNPNMANDDPDIIKREKLLENILSVSTVNTNTVKTVKKIASQYYQYTQFKRAHFNCTEVSYDTATGRVCTMKFELQIKNGLVVFN